MIEITGFPLKPYITESTLFLLGIGSFLLIILFNIVSKAGEPRHDKPKR